MAFYLRSVPSLRFSSIKLCELQRYAGVIMRACGSGQIVHINVVSLFKEKYISLNHKELSAKKHKKKPPQKKGSISLHTSDKHLPPT